MIQCQLVKDNTNITAWIPVKFAETGRYLKLIGDNGWLVTKVFGSIKLDSGYVREHQRVRFASI